MVKGAATFMLPGRERDLNILLNHPDIKIVINERYAMAKDGFILNYIQWEDYRDDTSVSVFEGYNEEMQDENKTEEAF